MNKKIISFTLTILVLLSFALVGCTPNKSPDKEQESIVNDFSSEFINTEFVKLSMGGIMPMSSGSSVSKTLTATVLPATATNKAVDWTVEWADSENTSDISQYVTVIPTSNGNTTATVTCHKAFTGNVIITVTTRESGYSAACVVTFIGIPTNITISGSVNPTAGAYRLGIGETYEFNVTLTNPFNNVGGQFNNITCGINGVGSVILGYMEHYNSSGTSKWFDEQDKTVTLDSLKDNFITVSYSNNKLSVTTIKSIESYYASSQRLDSGRTRAYIDKFRSFVDDCYFKVWIKENTSGLTKEYIIRFDESIVTGIDISNGEMFF